MATANLFWWLGAGCFVTAIVWGSWRRQDQPLPGILYLLGIGFFDLSMIFDPRVGRGWDLWLPMGVLTSLGLLYAFLSLVAARRRRCADRKEEERDGISTLQQGQADGELSEGAEGL